MFGNEVVCINYKSGKYYWTENVGAAVISLIESGLSDAVAIAGHIKNRYQCSNVDIQGDIAEFINTLRSELLVVPFEEPRVSKVSESALLSQNSSGKKSPYQKPVIEIFDDMEKLIKLDPIHEIDGRGWPHLKNT